MASFKTDRRKVFFLILLVVADSTRAKVLPLRTVRLETVSSRQHRDLPAVTSGTAPHIEDDPLKSESDRLITAATDTTTKGDNNTGPAMYPESGDTELLKEAYDITKNRDKMMTDDTALQTAHIMQDIDDYNRKMIDFGDVNDTIREQCGEDTLSAVNNVLVHLGEKKNVVNVLSIVALLQLNGCPSAAANITTRLLAPVEEDGKDEKKRRDVLPLVGSYDYCDHVTDCQKTGIPAVRQQMAGHSSLRAAYDVVVAAVFASTQSGSVSDALLRDVTADFNRTIPDVNITDRKRSDCNNADERIAQEVISMIPFAGSIYNGVSAAVYHNKGCSDLASSRTKAQVVTVISDIATVAAPVVGAAIKVGKAVYAGAKYVGSAISKAAAPIASAISYAAAPIVSGVKTVISTVTDWFSNWKRSIREKGNEHGASRVSRKDVSRVVKLASVIRDGV